MSIKIITFKYEDGDIQEQIVMDGVTDGYLGLYPFNNIHDYWVKQFETMGKEWISSDYGYFLEYMHSEDLELVNKIDFDLVIDKREITEEDMKAHNKELWRFYRLNQIEMKDANWAGFKVRENYNQTTFIERERNGSI